MFNLIVESQANGAVYAALLKAGDKILGMDLSHGGHLTHGSKPSFSGQNYSAFYYGVELDGRINYDKVARDCKNCYAKNYCLWCKCIC